MPPKDYGKMTVVAEIGTAHGGSLEKARQLIDAAADAGAHAVKFQWVYADEILHPDTGFVTLPGGRTRLYDRFRGLEVPPSFFADCRDYARRKGTQFICSPFGLRSLAELLPLRPDAVKIASPELNHYPLLRALADYRRTDAIPVILSSGVSTLADIERALAILGTDGVTLLHCVTSYPAPETDYNLTLVRNLSRIFGIATGVSDHSLDPVLVPSLSAAAGAVMLEKHITLSKETDGLDDPVALDGGQFAHLCHCVRQCAAMLRRYGQPQGSGRIIAQMEDEYGAETVRAVLGDGIKRLATSERDNYGRTNRSLHFLRALKKGETVTADDIGVLRTEKVLTPGISPAALQTIVGATMTRDAQNGAGVQWEDVLCRE